MNRPNWNKAPSWANWGATCAVSGNQEWFSSYPEGPGFVDIWPRPSSGASTDHAAELAAQLQNMLDWFKPKNTDDDIIVQSAGMTLQAYKQSRGE